jgi:ppGpp synthetase/RelA/SpoT-type nucleotidyltranferase
VEDLVGIDVHSIIHRLKSFDSALKKSQDLNIPISELQDIAGMRIVVATADEVDVVVDFFSKKQYFKDFVIESDKVIERKNGYRARHLVLKFNGHYSRFSCHETYVEVQILTLLQHTFNYISRSWIYKTERALPHEWHTEFQELSHTLAKVDKQIAKLHKSVIDVSASVSDNEPLTPYSYQKIIGDVFGETETLNNAVDNVLRLVDLGCDTNGKLRQFFGDSSVLDFRERILKLNSNVGKHLAQMIMEMSIHQFFLSHGLRMAGAEEFLQAFSKDV